MAAVWSRLIAEHGQCPASLGYRPVGSARRPRDVVLCTSVIRGGTDHESGGELPISAVEPRINERIRVPRVR
ncbi:MAG: hypothetical protein RBS78_01895, partial [Coriobacteriia bacterium]|nr:hypothetical protein [Coriobacteriia bacterium]